jgi:putative ABC transport system substrate-binding protein
MVITMKIFLTKFFVVPAVFALLLVGSLLAPSQLFAQETLAAIITADLPRYQQVHEAMAGVLQTAGFGEDKLKIFKQTPNADKMSLANSLRRAEAAGATLVVTYGSYATSVAANELKDASLLFADVYDPVELGAVKTLTAPGTNASGATSKTDLSALLEALVSLKQVKTIGALYTKGQKGSEQQLADLKKLAENHGVSFTAENARNPKEALTLGTKLAAKADALFLTESVAVGLQSKEITSAAQSKGCAVFSQIPGLVETGALLGLEADPTEQGKLVAVHALQALQGQKVLLLPVREAKKIDLKVNQKTADSLGLQLPAALAAKAKVL